MDYNFKNSSSVDKDPLSFASTNWLVSAKFLSREYKNGIFVDIGSTTTDVVPIVNGEIKANRRDLGRLKRGELIYFGVLRTSVSSLLKRVEIGGEEYRISSEYFATTADAYLVLGYTMGLNDSYSPPTLWCDRSVEKAKQRLARVLCSDLEEIGEEGAVGIAEQVKEAQVSELIDSMKRIKKKYGLKKVISAGIGDFIVKDAAKSLDIDFLSLSSRYGKEISAVFPAYAVAKLLGENHKIIKSKIFYR